MEFWEGKRVLVTGGAGMIGSHLVEKLLEASAKVDVLDDLSRGNKDNIPWGRAGWEWFGLRLWRYTLGDGRRYDTTLAEAWQRQAFEDKDVVFHLAAKVAGIEYNRHRQYEMMATNMAINQEVMELVARYEPGYYVYVSTACIYPHDAPIPTPESAGDVCNPEPTNYGYGLAKWVGEQQAKMLHRERGIPTAIVRFFNAAGLRDYYDRETSHVIPALIRRFKEGRNPVVVWGTGLQKRTFIDCRDLAKALMLIVEGGGCDGQATNVGHHQEVTIANLAERIKELLDSPAAIEFDASYPEGYPRRVADTSRLRNITGGWIPDTPLAITLMDMIGDYEERYPDGFTD